jgi:hypothetical protein
MKTYIFIKNLLTCNITSQHCNNSKYIVKLSVGYLPHQIEQSKIKRYETLKN